MENDNDEKPVTVLSALLNVGAATFFVLVILSMVRAIQWVLVEIVKNL